MRMRLFGYLPEFGGSRASGPESQGSEITEEPLRSADGDVFIDNETVVPEELYKKLLRKADEAKAAT
eukprot:CAMPEP_0194529600 /NCGR_PEP_ID=MMETSP0253-20130528/66341_1 /TAXON_ID=2966 /ORGANISM="Noctiluca scintillans" /LENGTH=66 /DNA_ID=CAMNT_0039374753 /DNA_START=68 /DNA_END=264 /DNA_ORIENTATION=+